ncbi:DUF1963 domain-containing protein [Brucella cytisi]|uniref:DUF1963 domain-containing protein n=1 Tax=Brucella cytisi TaxID=407152 RepID=UPI0035E1AFDB
MSSVSFPEDHSSLLRSLRETNLPLDIVSHLASQARSAILMITSDSDEDTIPLGSSKIGGKPDLPRGMTWPNRPPYPDADVRAEGHRKEAGRLLADSKKPRSWMTPEQGERFSAEYRQKADAVKAGFPLAFLGQINLADLSRESGFDLLFPSEGRLLIFYDYWEQPEDFTPEASVGWQVLWDTTPVDELVRASTPTELSSISDDKWSCIFRAARISTRSILTPIPPNDRAWNAFSLNDDEALEEYQEWLSQFGTPDMVDRDNHQFGGFPQTLQNGLQASSQLAANGLNCGGREVWKTDAAEELLKSAKDWRLVIQIGVDPHAGIPQPGAYYVIMREQDIMARKFDRARVTYQCD